MTSKTLAESLRIRKNPKSTLDEILFECVQTPDNLQSFIVYYLKNQHLFRSKCLIVQQIQ